MRRAVHDHDHEVQICQKKPRPVRRGGRCGHLADADAGQPPAGFPPENGRSYHLNDPKTISWALAYSKAVHSAFWGEAATDKEKEKLVSGFRSKILGQAANKKDGSKEHNLAKILLEEPEDGPEGVDMARKKLEELYEPEMVRKYVQAHLEYAASVIAPFLPDMSVQDIINTVEKDGEIPKKRIVIAKNLSEEKAELLRQAIQNARVQGFRFETSSKRVYSVPECMVHILGYIAQTKDSGPRPFPALKNSWTTSFWATTASGSTGRTAGAASSPPRIPVSRTPWTA